MCDLVADVDVGVGVAGKGCAEWKLWLQVVWGQRLRSLHQIPLGDLVCSAWRAADTSVPQESAPDFCR